MWFLLYKEVLLRESDDNNLIKILGESPANKTIQSALAKSYEVLRNHHNIQASISGGSDSDIMLDILLRTGRKEEIDFIWFNTGMEFKATREHLTYLEEKYGISIERIMPKISVVMSCRKYGVPFMNKNVSEFCMRLQKHNFQWEDEPFDVLIERYPRCKSALKWWCNCNPEPSQFNINHNSYLKEFMVSTPPTFRISNKCCFYAKKSAFSNYMKEHNNDLDCMGVRKAERGVRSAAYKSCYIQKNGKTPLFLPIFWMNDADKLEYEKNYEIVHSKCYREYGLARTGCAGCPFNIEWENELKIIEKNEPSLFRACWNVFGESYKYRIEYENFRKEMKLRRKEV